MNHFTIGTMLPSLRTATSEAHTALDASFGALALQQRDDYQRFLRAHALGLAPLFETYSEFVTHELGIPCPDFMGMLHADLADLGENFEQFPLLSVPADLDAAGVAYVVSGSRLGLAMIRRSGYWGRDNGLPSRYMDDESGLVVWKALLTWMKQRQSSLEDDRRASHASLAAFDAFGRAFHASAVTSVH